MSFNKSVLVGGTPSPNKLLSLFSLDRISSYSLIPTLYLVGLTTGTDKTASSALVAILLINNKGYFA